MNVMYFDNILKSKCAKDVENVLYYITDKGILWFQEKHNISKNEIKNLNRNDKRLFDLYNEHPIIGFNSSVRIKKIKKKYYVVSLYSLPYCYTEKIFEFNNIYDAFKFIEDEKSNTIDISNYPNINKNILLKLKDIIKKFLRRLYRARI